MKILFAAGGTGGHINPALAVAGKIRERMGDDAEILFVGTPTHMETRLVPEAGFDFASVDVRGFYRGLSWKNIKRDTAAVFKMFSGSRKAKKIIKDFDPDVAIGFGGYVSGPVIRKAHKMGVPKDMEPFITLSFMALPVIPEIRCTPRGVFSVTEWQMLKASADVSPRR